MAFAAFEIPMFTPQDLPTRDLRRGFESSDLECTICAILPTGINPISPDRAVRKRSRIHLVECIEGASEMGAHLLGGPLFAPIGYLPGHRRTGDEWKWAVELFQSLTGLLEENAITLSIEPVNRSETFFLRTAEEARALCAAVAHPLVGVTLDTFHANIEEKSIPSALKLLGPTLAHVHMSENDRGLLGAGHIDFPEILNALDSIGYDQYLMIEGFGFSPDEAHAPGALWADAMISPEDIAIQGLAFIEKLTG
jgi:D-psicose/D-tagatose/L-ribulose 3-epimerase